MNATALLRHLRNISGNSLVRAGARRIAPQRFVAMTLLAGLGLNGSSHHKQSCVNPVQFNAIPNDSKDDRDAFQKAIDKAIRDSADVCIGAGVWEITKIPGQAAPLISSLHVWGVARPMAIYGAGPSTRVRMLGAGNGGDWNLLEIGEGSAGVLLKDMSLDGSNRSVTGEQTHLLQLRGPVSHVRVQNVQFNLPEINGVGGGDCIRLMGEPDREVQAIELHEVTGTYCDRSFVSFQRGVRGVL
ncbi:MAG: hypothetical protein H7Z40_19240, partial [Phycisphaerae bacterium]|nr:hypothetical protein [Gemmatimonadaceae bacterium]